MVVHITVFVIVVIFSAIAEYFRDKNKMITNIMFILAVGILVLFSSLRYWVGTDYAEYFYSYDAAVRNVLDNLKAFDEPGISFLAWLSDKTVGNFSGMFAYAALLTIGLFGIAIYKNSNNYLYSFALLIMAGCWSGSFNAVRQYIAISIVLVSHRFIFERKFWKYLIAVIIATAFHRSALLFVILYFIINKETNAKLLFAMILISVFFFFGEGLILRFIGENIDRYSSTSFENNPYVLQRVNTLRILVSVTPVIIAWFFYGKNGINSDEERAFYFNFLLFNALLSIGTSGSAYLARFAIYTNAFVPIAYPRLFSVKSIGKQKNPFLLLNVFAIIFYSVFWIYEISINYNLYTWRWITENTDYNFSVWNWLTNLF